VLQLATNHWFYLYVVWFLPAFLVAALAAYREAPEAPAEELPLPARAPVPA
jgi:hypothetical protein